MAAGIWQLSCAERASLVAHRCQVLTTWAAAELLKKYMCSHGA